MTRTFSSMGSIKARTAPVGRKRNTWKNLPQISDLITPVVHFSQKVFIEPTSSPQADPLWFLLQGLGTFFHVRHWITLTKIFGPNLEGWERKSIATTWHQKGAFNTVSLESERWSASSDHFCGQQSAFLLCHKRCSQQNVCHTASWASLRVNAVTFQTVPSGLWSRNREAAY